MYLYLYLNVIVIILIIIAWYVHFWNSSGLTLLLNFSCFILFIHFSFLFFFNSTIYYAHWNLLNTNDQWMFLLLLLNINIFYQNKVIAITFAHLNDRPSININWTYSSSQITHFVIHLISNHKTKSTTSLENKWAIDNKSGDWQLFFLVNSWNSQFYFHFQ